MGFFDSKEAELKRVPLSGWQRQGLQFMMGGLNDPDLPQQRVAGMSDAERAVQGILVDVLAGRTFEDPRTSDYYRGLRAESMDEEARGAQAIRRGGQLGGMLNSSSNMGVEGRYRQGMANNRLSLLGGLYNQERQMDNPYTRLQAGAQYGALPRQLQQAGYDVGYQNAMAPLQFQYGQQMPIAQSLATQAPTYYMTAPEASPFSQWAGLLGAGAGAIGGAMIPGSTPQSILDFAKFGGGLGGAFGNAWG